MMPHFPGQCEHCGNALSEQDDVTDDPERRQVAELPQVKIIVTEHHLHRRKCRSCGTTTKASMPASIGESAVGPRMQAELAHLVAVCKLPRRAVVRYAADNWGTDISLGTIGAVEQRVSAALEKPYTQALTVVRQADVRYVDETSWPQNDKKGWMWTAVCKAATVFKIAGTRAMEELQELLGDAASSGSTVSDRYKGYNAVPMAQRGICWAHLKRDFAKIAGLGGPQCSLGITMGYVHQQVFALWHRFKAGHIDREALKTQLLPQQRSMRALLEEGTRHKHTKIAGMCADILRHWPAMWNFAAIEGMEPTNNAAERAHRQAVTWRKICFGTRSNGGSRFTERMLTIAETCRQNGVNVLGYLTRAISAAIVAQPAPALVALPTPDG